MAADAADVDWLVQFLGKLDETHTCIPEDADLAAYVLRDMAERLWNVADQLEALSGPTGEAA